MIHGLKMEKIMTRALVKIKPQDSLKYAKELMALHGVRHLPVMDGGKFIGLISDRDIKEASFFRGPGELRAEEIMSTDLISAPPEAQLTDIVYAMLVKKINAVPIVRSDGELVGIFTSYDLMRLVLDYASAEEERKERHKVADLIPFPQGQSLEWNRGEPVHAKRPEPPFHPSA